MAKGSFLAIVQCHLKQCYTRLLDPLTLFRIAPSFTYSRLNWNIQTPVQAETALRMVGFTGPNVINCLCSLLFWQICVSLIIIALLHQGTLHNAKEGPEKFTGTIFNICKVPYFSGWYDHLWLTYYNLLAQGWPFSCKQRAHFTAFWICLIYLGGFTEKEDIVTFSFILVHCH